MAWGTAGAPRWEAEASGAAEVGRWEVRLHTCEAPQGEGPVVEEVVAAAAVVVVMAVAVIAEVGTARVEPVSVRADRCAFSLCQKSVPIQVGLWVSDRLSQRAVQSDLYAGLRDYAGVVAQEPELGVGSSLE